MHLYTLKHQLTLTFKTLKNLKHFNEVTPTCFGSLIRPFSGGSYAVLCVVTTDVQLKSGPYFNMSNLFTKIYNMLYYTTNLYLQ
jgi:hypothetical protein